MPPKAGQRATTPNTGNKPVQAPLKPEPSDGTSMGTKHNPEVEKAVHTNTPPVVAKKIAAEGSVPNALRASSLGKSKKD